MKGEALAFIDCVTGHMEVNNLTRMFISNLHGQLKLAKET